MAGDWIKIEHVMPDKPEVAIIAESCGIDHDAAVGKLVRVWIWADQQTLIGNAPSVTKTIIDRFTCVIGFASAMEKAGWMAIENGAVTFPNFDRHNGNSAKQRALTNKRVKRNRNAPSVTKSLPEKRREEKSIKTPQTPRKRGATPSPREHVHCKLCGRNTARGKLKTAVNKGAIVRFCPCGKEIERIPTEARTEV